MASAMPVLPEVGSISVSPGLIVPRASPQELAEQKLIQYIPFPAQLQGKYQSYTQADLSKLRAAGLPGAFMGVEEGVAAYVKELMKE